MPFLDSVRQRINQYAPGSAERLILEFLLQHGVGRHNAQPWGTIEAHLQGQGLQVRLQTFQQGLLKESREGDMYIGSNDHEPSRGYFIIADRGDADLMAQWYQRRIATEHARLQHLTDLMNQQWP
jgi:hypothetical protein